MMVSHPLPIPLPFTSELYGVRLFNGCWLFAKQTFQPSYWMMLKREGFSGDLVGNSSELSLVLGMLGAEHLRAIYTLYHGSPPTHFFDFSLRGDIEHLILSGRIKAFYLSEDKTERLGNPQDVLYANPDSIDLNCESPVVAQRYRLAEELATDIMARWTQKDAEDLAHWDRFVLWRKGYEAYDITAEAFDTVYDFIVGLKDIAVFVVEISYEAAKTQLKVNRALLEMTYKGATGDIDGLRADLAKVGVMVDEKIDSAQKLIAQAEQGKKIFDALVNDPLTRNLIFDFLDSLYQSISYRESRTFKARIVFEIGIEVLLALATAGIGNVARRTAQTARATTNAIKATKTAQRIGPFTKHALDLMADLAKVMNKPIHVEEIPPVKGLELPDFGKLSKSELGGVGDSKATVKVPEDKPSTSSVREGEGIPDKFGEIYAKAPAAKIEIDEVADDISEMFGGQVAKAPIKSQDRAIQKIMNHYDGDATRIKDLARNTIIVPPDKLDSVVAELAKRGASVKVIDGAKDPLGYSGVNATIETQAGIVGEIQVNTPAMIYAKESEPMARALIGDDLYTSIATKSGIPGGQGHKLYEQWRVLPDSDPERLAIETQSKAYYDAVRRSINGN
ncbi:hypothetical protein QFX18_02225 [Saccharophagus degradans]|uniref:hypothetical protein n=1 Tax=Saccharophagus degradans TaxID=86304 RepID=UPI002477CC93|nr:hypothetical protein [Saccharophagus degradans]WGO98876.1 hypothetical protein QFX18_02225 [Saccharophagus degradans]